MSDKTCQKWSGRGKLFKSKKALHNFLKSLPEINPLWELVTVELVVQNDMAQNLKTYFQVWKGRKKGKI